MSRTVNKYVAFIHIDDLDQPEHSASLILESSLCTHGRAKRSFSFLHEDIEGLNRMSGCTG